MGLCRLCGGLPGDGKTTSSVIISSRRFGMKKNASGKFEQKGSCLVTDLKGDIYAANKKKKNGAAIKIHIIQEL